MLIKEKIPLIRVKLGSNGNLRIPKAVREMYGLEYSNDIVIGVFEILKHAEISKLPSFSVSFG